MRAFAKTSRHGAKNAQQEDTCPIYPLKSNEIPWPDVNLSNLSIVQA